MQIIADAWAFFADMWSEWEGKALIIFLLSVALILGAMLYLEVDSWHLHEGKITAKRHRPMWVETQCIPSGKSIICHPVYHPESWNVTIEGIDDRQRKATRTVSVSREQYDALREGEHFTVDRKVEQ